MTMGAKGLQRRLDSLRDGRVAPGDIVADRTFDEVLATLEREDTITVLSFAACRPGLLSHCCRIRRHKK